MHLTNQPYSLHRLKELAQSAHPTPVPMPSHFKTTASPLNLRLLKTGTLITRKQRMKILSLPFLTHTLSLPLALLPNFRNPSAHWLILCITSLPSPRCTRPNQPLFSQQKHSMNYSTISLKTPPTRSRSQMTPTTWSAPPTVDSWPLSPSMMWRVCESKAVSSLL